MFASEIFGRTVMHIFSFRNSNWEKPQKRYKLAFCVKRPHTLSDGQWGQVWRSWRLVPLCPWWELVQSLLVYSRDGKLPSLSFLKTKTKPKQLYWEMTYIVWNSPVSISVISFLYFYTVVQSSLQSSFRTFPFPYKVSLCLFAFISSF